MRLLHIPLVCLLLLLAACAQSAQPTPLPAEPASSEEPVGEPEPAPTAEPDDGLGRLLFVRGGNIWLWQNGRATQLTEDGGYRQPRWSPNGDGMVYVRVGESFSDLVLADPRAANGRKLTTNQARGVQIESKAYVEGSALVSGPTWGRTATGGDRIVYSTDRDLAGFGLMLFNGVAARSPTPLYGTQELGGHIEGAALSPDGNTVAFVHELTDPRTGARATQLFVADVNTGTYRALTGEPGGAYDPAWSPDGKWLAYAARQEKGTDTNLWVIRTDGTGRQRLTDGGRNRGVAWSPDGGRLAFARQQGNGFGLFFIEIDTSSGTIAPGKPQRLGDFADVDPTSGTSWVR